jgi:hypothetical protein
MGGTFKWWPIHNGRHAIPGEMEPGDIGKTICGLDLTYTGRTPKKTDWQWPTCKTCNQAAYSLTHVLLAGHRR